MTIEAPSQKTSTRAAAGASIILISQVIGYGLYFVAQRLILSGMSKEDFGSLTFLQQMCSLVLVILVDAGMNNVALREMISKPEQKRSIIASVFWMRIAGVVFTSILLSLISLLYGYDSVTLVVLAVIMIAFNSRSSMVRSAIELPLRENMSFTLVSLTFVFDFVVYLFLLYLYRDSLTPFNIFVLQLLSSLPGFLFIGWKVRIIQLLFPLPSWENIRGLFGEVRPMAAQLLSQNIHSAIDLSVLKLYAPLKEIGVLGAVMNMGTIILTTYSALAMALYPMVSEALHSTRGNAVFRVERTLSFITYISVVLATLLGVTSPFIAYIFTKNVYADNIFEFQFQFWLAVVVSISQTALIITSAQNEHKAMLFSGMILIVGSLSADFVLIPTYYTAGLIGAKIWSNLLATAVSLWYIGQRLNFTFIRLYIARTLALFALTVPYTFLSLRYLSMPQAFVIGVVLCAAAGWFLGFISKDEIELFVKLRRKLGEKLGFKNSAQA